MTFPVVASHCDTGSIRPSSTFWLVAALTTAVPGWDEEFEEAFDGLYAIASGESSEAARWGAVKVDSPCTDWPLLWSGRR